MSNNPVVRELINKWSKADYNPFEKTIEDADIDPIHDLNIPPLFRAHVANLFHSLIAGMNSHINHEQVLRDTVEFVTEALKDYDKAEKLVYGKKARTKTPNKHVRVRASRNFDTLMHEGKPLTIREKRNRKVAG
tara:strand:+ start:117 stop:518 length:402 start_codon:yes stop_codon:yes gene_type:complete